MSRRRARRHDDVPELRPITRRDDDVTVTPILRAYLRAFDLHLRAVAANDHRAAYVSRGLMTGLLHGVRDGS